ncbi:MAG: dihydrolipoamide acetyltransferase family protein [Armatimonadota bacterium]|jgi:pyruvate dehydrogenase E2 component (dihydrolipoamide acetyltransferase)
MATKMVMPLLGQTMEEGTIIKWFKNEGDALTAGEPLLEVMTDKVNMEVEAPEDGVLLKILAQVDDIVPVQDPIAIIGAAGESIDDLLSEKPAEKPITAEAEIAAPSAPAVAPGPVVEQAAPAPVAPQAPIGKVISSPSARREASQRGIDINLLAGRGTGPNGRITEADVLAFAASVKATPLAGKVAADMGVSIGEVPGTGIGGRITRADIERATAATAAVPAGIGAAIPFTGMRKMVAQNVSASAHSAVHVTLVTEVDMSACVALREQLLADVEKQYGVRISYTDIIIKAAARAIYDVPIVNASLQEDKIVIADSMNIGVATAIEGGLLVPVVKNVQSKSVIEISREVKAMAERARTGKSTPEDLSGGTFTITNLGVYGVDTFTPIITPGQSAILAVCRIVDKPVVVNGEVVIKPMMNLCLSFDHRIMDGAPAAQYLARLRDILQAPALILL